jgi:isoquinoline 1-oxidoreductase beta subunit
VRQVVIAGNEVAMVDDQIWAAKRGGAALQVHRQEGAPVSMQGCVSNLARAVDRQGAVAREDGGVETTFASARARVESPVASLT